MITEDYVSFKTAKLLKEKGFCEPCFGYYSEYVDNWRTFKIWKRYPKTYDTVRNDGYVLVPTIQMAMKWLVRKYKLYVNVVPSVEGYYWTEKWHSYVEDLNKRYPFGRFISTLNSPEEACETAIKYCLENLITPSLVPEQ